MCPNCTLNRSRKSIMKGPVPDPAGKARGLFFVCDRCGWQMTDRRKTEREDAGKD